MTLRLFWLVMLGLSLTDICLFAQSTSPADTSSREAKNREAYRKLSRSAEDSSRSVFNFKAAPWYGRASPFSIYTGAGSPKDRIAQNIEIGKSFNVVDLGIAFGRNSLRPDTSLFVEGRVTMDVANYGVFANEMTIGAGRVFDKQGSLMLELTYSIIAQISPRLGVGLTTGYYDFSNETDDNSKAFYGVYLRWGLMRIDSGGLINIGQSHGRRVRTRQAKHRAR